MYKDGVSSASETNFKTGHVIKPAGSLVLGQKQGSLADGYNTTQSFQGMMSNLNVWDYVLCPKVVERMSKACLSAWQGNVYKWSHFKHGIEGKTRLFVPSPCDPQKVQPGTCDYYWTNTWRRHCHELYCYKIPQGNQTICTSVRNLEELYMGIL